MELRDEKIWNDWYQKNEDDPYGKCCFDIARDWANLMEDEIANGKTIAECADPMFEIADEMPGYGITGFMYGMVISILAQCWKYGEELRRWHNLKTQISKEGEEANKNGGTLNPALLTIGPKQ